MSRLHKGKHIYIDGAVFILQGDRLQHSIVFRRNVKSAFCQKAVAEAETLNGVVIPADEKHGQMTLPQIHQELVQKPDRFHGRNGFIIDVSGNQNDFYGFTVCDFQDLLQNIFLVLDHGKLVDPLSQMKVG